MKMSRASFDTSIPTLHRTAAGLSVMCRSFPTLASGCGLVMPGQLFGIKRTDESNVTCLSAVWYRPVRSRTVAFTESEDYCLSPTYTKHTSGQYSFLLTVYEIRCRRMA